MYGCGRRIRRAMSLLAQEIHSLMGYILSELVEHE